MIDRYDVATWMTAGFCGTLIGAFGRRLGMANWECVLAGVPVFLGVAAIFSAWRARRR